MLSVEQALTAVGTSLRYLPPYSLDFNPIEKLFARLKAMLRKASKRNVDALWKELGRLLDNTPPQEYQNYFESCGYCKEKIL